jgi:hypothetical protein
MVNDRPKASTQGRLLERIGPGLTGEVGVAVPHFGIAKTPCNHPKTNPDRREHDADDGNSTQQAE